MANQLKLDNVTFAVGDTIRVHQKIQEGDKTRIQPFEGIVISIKGEGENKMFTVRKIATGAIGVERIWPAFSPWIQKIEVKKQGSVRRAKLYYLRKKVGKRAVKVKAKRIKKETKETKETGKTKVKKKTVKTKADEKKRSRPARRRTSRQRAKKE